MYRLTANVRSAAMWIACVALLACVQSSLAQSKSIDITEDGDDPQMPEACSETGLVYPSCTWLDDDGAGVNVDGVRRFQAKFTQSTNLVKGIFVDPTGSVIIGGRQLVSNKNELVILKYDRAGEKVFNPQSPGVSADSDICDDIAIDLRGDIFVAEEFFDSDSGYTKLGIIKLRGGNGSTIWSDVWPPSNYSFETRPWRIFVDDEGNCYVAGWLENPVDENGDRMHELFAIKYGPDGDRQWVFRMPMAKNDGTIVNQVATDATGNLYICAYSFSPSATTLVKLTRNGDVSPSWKDTGVGVGVRKIDGEKHVAMVVQRSSRLMIAGSDASNRPKIRIYENDGALTRNSAANGVTGSYNDVATNEAGEWAVAGFVGADDSREIITNKFNPDGTATWGSRKIWDGSGLADVGTSVFLDRFGNVYSGGYTTVAAGNTAFVVIKYKMDDGAYVWDVDHGYAKNAYIWDPGNKLDGVTFARKDGGGQIYLGGYVQRSDGTYDTTVVKLGQPFESAPQQVFSSDITMETTGQSIWGPGTGRLEAAFDVFSRDFEVIENPEGTWHSDVLGDFGGGVDFELKGAEIGVGVRALADGGSVDAIIPFSALIDSPGRGDIFAGKDVTLSTTLTRDASGSVAISATTLEAAVTGVLKADAKFHVWAEAFSLNILDWTFVDRTIGFDDDLLSTTDLLGGAISRDFDLPSDLGGGTVQLPQIAPRGSFDGDGSAHLQGDDPFLTMRADITNFISSKFGYPTVFSAGDDLPGAGSYEVEAGVAQVYLQTDFSLDQTFDFTPGAPRVRFSFSDGRDPVEINVGEQLKFKMPNTSDAEAEITLTPTFLFKEEDNFTTTTKATFRPEVGFDGLYGSLFAEAFDYSLVDFYRCFQCYPYSPGQLSVTLDTNRFALGGFRQIQGAPFTIIGEKATRPELLGVSRSGVDTYIYDQLSVVNDRSTVQADFDEFVSGTTPMILYGTNFFKNSGWPRAFFEFQGQRERLTATWLSNNELLVEFPNKFRLISGTGRLQVQTRDEGKSNSFDFKISNPFPNIATAGPNLWASDPDFTDLLITVVDGKTSANTDSYIARSDYYVQLRQLWADSPLGASGTLDAAFPQVNFNGLPPMPKILWNTDTLTPYGEPLDSGLLWAQLPKSYYASPLNVDIAVVAPGPGGGTSSTVPIIVSAPRPEITEISPSIIPPGGGDLRIVITGPPHVSHWADRGVKGPFNEQERRSNFNKSTVVYWNGAPNAKIQQIFISSSRIEAIIPAALLTIGGTNYVSVYTPPNDTVYFDRNTGGSVPSGGLSNRLRFIVAYPRPVLEAVSPTQLSTSSLDYAAGERDHDLSVIGTNFSPTSKVYWNGSNRTTIFESDTMLLVKLKASDVESVGDNRVYIVTPSPGGGRSRSLIVTVNEDPDHEQPTLTHLVPDTAIAGSDEITVAVIGTGFYRGTRVFWGNDTTPLIAEFVSDTRMDAVVPAEKLRKAGKFAIKVLNAPPGGGESDVLDFEVID